MKNMKAINVVLVHLDGRTTTFSRDTWVQAATAVVESVEQASKGVMGQKRVERVFTSTGDYLEEHEVRDLQEALATGILAKVDAQQQRS